MFHFIVECFTVFFGFFKVNVSARRKNIVVFAYILEVSRCLATISNEPMEAHRKLFRLCTRLFEDTKHFYFQFLTPSGV